VSKQCYMCKRVATSREHVPPKCIFPERKDVPGEDFRSQLITIPSCDQHNLSKSKDDEFLLISIAGVIGNNSIGYRQNQTKIGRSLKKASVELLQAFYAKGLRTVDVDKTNKFLVVILGTQGYNRLEKCFDHIARGLYFHHFNRQFHGRMKIVFGHLLHPDKNSNSFVQFVNHKAEFELREIERCGSNQTIFFYQFTPPDNNGLFLLRLCFYEGVNVFVSLMPTGASTPFDLGMKLIGSGIKTCIMVEDKEYWFNEQEDNTANKGSEDINAGASNPQH
jgi:hypothetical protein